MNTIVVLLAKAEASWFYMARYSVWNWQLTWFSALFMQILWSEFPL